VMTRAAPERDSARGPPPPAAPELQHLDHYEGELYERRALSVRVGGSTLSAVGYVLGDGHRSLLSTEPWELAAFERDHLADYLEHISVTRRAP
jgi:hypothetical protein